MQYRPSSQRPAAENHHHREGAFHERPQQIAGDGGAVTLGQCRDQDQEGDDRQVLEQQHRHGQTAVLQADLGLLRELLRDDGGGGHGEGAAQHDGHGRFAPINQAMTAVPRVVSSTWAPPSTNTALRMTMNAAARIPDPG